MDCDKALELISLRLDELLTEEEERALDAHLEDCGPCRSLLLELTALRDAMPEEEEPPEGFLDGVMERVRGSKTVTFPVKKTGWKQWKSWCAMAAVFALVIAGAGGLRHTFVPDGNSGGAQPEAAYTASGDQGIAAQAETAPPTALPDEGLSYGDAPAEDKTVETQPQEGGPRTAMFSMDRPEETDPAEPEEVPGEVKPALTEAELAAMERLLDELGWAEYTWGNWGTYAIQTVPADSGVIPVLCYQGLSENARYYTFEVRERIYADGESGFHTTSLGAYAVPVGDGNTICGPSPEYDALLSE